MVSPFVRQIMRPGHSEYNKLKRTELKEKTAVGAKVKKESGGQKVEFQNIEK